MSYVLLHYWCEYPTETPTQQREYIKTLESQSKEATVAKWLSHRGFELTTCCWNPLLTSILYKQNGLTRILITKLWSKLLISLYLSKKIKIIKNNLCKWNQLSSIIIIWNHDLRELSTSYNNTNALDVHYSL